ncbi:MAG: ribosome biogenesis GTP-binding protein YihA/YsxC [bacterium]|nr:ribosome biogenesis GTP-binding protein YihA/YsxC [bacterium]
MNITSAKFIKGAVGTDPIFVDGTPQVAFIGRSNVGKSSVINTLTNKTSLARTSSFPGRTQQMNIFLINKAFYLVDLPGYGFAQVPGPVWEKIQKMISWYLFDSEYVQTKVVLIVDANIGLTKDDFNMLHSLEEAGKDIVIVANKIDKIKPSEYQAKMQSITYAVPGHTIIPYSAAKKIGVGELSTVILSVTQ